MWQLRQHFCNHIEQLRNTQICKNIETSLKLFADRAMMHFSSNGNDLLNSLMALKFTSAFLPSPSFFGALLNFSESRSNQGTGMMFLCAFVLPRRKATISRKNPYDSTSVSWVLGLITDKFTFPSNSSIAASDSSWWKFTCITWF